MLDDATGPDAEHDAWNPGLSSEIPRALRPRATLFDPKNSTVSYEEACSAATFCGLQPQDMVAFTPGRLAVHECLIRVTADLHVPDGPNYEDLGINMRSMVARILDGYVLPKLPDFEADFAAFRAEAARRIALLLDRDIFVQPAPTASARASGGLFASLFARKPEPAPPAPRPEFAALQKWQQATTSMEPGLERECMEALYTICAGIMRINGRLVGDKAMLCRLAVNRVNNRWGSHRIAKLIDPCFRIAAAAEGYQFLPAQKAPFVLNVKGASAAGKSTLRSYQRGLAERLGLPWEEFALVSPDYWRKFLLDYASLGPDYKYAAMLTGLELEIIDRKLDSHMEAKAARSQMPHLLIDRFRFDSFESLSSHPADGRLLSRFGDTVFMFFVVAPPAETVDRAWKRGLATGRYKAVDDILYHNVEAYTGMPQLFLNWVKKERQTVHFEFLDNGVPKGETPRTMAFGWNDSLTVLDPEGMRRLDLYKAVNLDARRPEDVLQPGRDSGCDFLSDCIRTIGTVHFLDPVSMAVLMQTRDGRCEYEREGFRAAHAFHCAPAPTDGPPPGFDAERERKFTVGTWRAPSGGGDCRK